MGPAGLNFNICSRRLPTAFLDLRLDESNPFYRPGDILKKYKILLSRFFTFSS